jgi:hypothetical protein
VLTDGPRAHPVGVTIGVKPLASIVTPILNRPQCAELVQSSPALAGLASPGAIDELLVVAHLLEDAGPSFAPSDVYRLQLMGEARFIAERGPITPELRAAVATYQARQARNGEVHRRRMPVVWRGDDAS